MTVSHVYPMFVDTGTEGITRNVEALCHALAGDGVDVVNRSPRVRLAELNHHSFLVVQSIRAVRQIRWDLQDPEVDVVHFHVGIPAMGSLLRAVAPALRRRKPVVLHAWNAFYRVGEDFSAADAVERGYHRIFNGPFPTLAALGTADAVVVSSVFQQRQIRALGHHGPVHVVPNGVDTTRFRPPIAEEREAARRHFGLGTGPVVLYYGHGSPWKGVDVFLDALVRVLRDDEEAEGLVSVTEYGDGGRGVKDHLEREGVADRVVLRGADDVDLLNAAADIAVLPAVAAVGTACHPNVLLEAMATGRAVVASRVGSIPEVVRHGENGLLARPADAVDLAKKILHLVEDEALRRRIGDEARRTMVQDHSWPRAAKHLRLLYRTLGDEDERATVASAGRTTRVEALP